MKHTFKGSFDLSSHFLSSGAYRGFPVGKMEAFQRKVRLGEKAPSYFTRILLAVEKKSTKIIAPLTKQLKIPFFEMFSWFLFHATFSFRPKWGPCC